MTGDPIEASAELVPASGSAVEARLVTSAPLQAVKDQFDAYQRLCRELLEKSDYQEVGSKSFPKKSAVRKLSLAFNVSTETLSEDHERDERGRIIRTETRVRATHPNGRFEEGVGASDVTERCCPAADGEVCDKASWDKHTCCPDGCSGRRHFSNPSHDIPATAHTRAKNRACLDLFGMGEVSAEEVGDGDRGSSGSNQGPKRGGPRAASEAQVGLIQRLQRDVKLTDDDLWAEIDKLTPGRREHLTELTSQEASKVIDLLNERKKGQ